MKRIALLILLLLAVLFLSLPAEASVGKWGPGVGGYNQYPLDPYKEEHNTPAYFKEFMLNGLGGKALLYLVERGRITYHQAEAIRQKIKKDDFEKGSIQPNEVFADGMTFLIDDEIRLTKEGQKIQYVGEVPEPARIIEAGGIRIIVPISCFNVAYKHKATKPTPANIDLPSSPTNKPTATITAKPSSIQQGKSTLLEWKTTNANKAVYIKGIGKVAENDSLEVSPQIDTIYELVAEGDGGEVAASTQVTVVVPKAATGSNLKISGDGENQPIDWPKIAKWTIIIMVIVAIFGVGLYFLLRDRGYHHDNDHGTLPLPIPRGRRGAEPPLMGPSLVPAN